MSEKVLLVGNNVRNIAESAKKAGFTVYAITKFADADLQLYCNEILKIPEDEREVKKLVEKVAEREDARVILSSGFEELDAKVEMLCSDPGECRKIVDKLRFYRTLEKAGIPHPEIVDEVSRVSREVSRVVIKPRKGGGGEEVSCERVEDAEDIAEDIGDDYVVQEYIEGIPCSVSLIAYEEKAKVVASNLILAGWKDMNASGFRYSGNVTPLKATLNGERVDTEMIREMEKLAVEVVSLFNLRGSVGVDFILADKPYVLEVNPRFQGSLDSIEWSSDVNLFKLHLTAFYGGEFDEIKFRRFGFRAVLFSDRRLVVEREPVGNPFFADVPGKGEEYLPNDPLVSILASGNNLQEAKRKILERKNTFLHLVSQNIASQR